MIPSGESAPAATSLGSRLPVAGRLKRSRWGSCPTTPISPVAHRFLHERVTAMYRTLLASPLVLVLLGWSHVASADLCAKCQKMAFIQSIGECSSCGGTTSSGAFKLCKKCSVKTGRCEHCLAPLKTGRAIPASEKGDRPPKKIDPDKSAAYTHGAWKYTLNVQAVGTRSEARWGRLSYDNRELAASSVNDYYETPWGRLYWVGNPRSRFGDHRWMPYASQRQPGVRGKRLAPPRAAAQPPALTMADNGRTVKVAAGTSLHIRLEGNPTTGYTWRTAKVEGDAVKQEGKPIYQSRQHRPGMVGVGGAFVFAFKAVKPGAATISLEYVRPWEKGKKPERTFAVTIQVAGK